MLKKFEIIILVLKKIATGHTVSRNGTMTLNIKWSRLRPSLLQNLQGSKGPRRA